MRLPAFLAPLLACATAAAEVSGTTAVDPDARRRAEEQAFGHARAVTGTERVAFVTFTFDDGPHHLTTPDVVAALESHDVPATFFVVGRRFTGKSRTARQNAEILADLAARGFTLGNHTYDHENLRDKAPAAAEKAIERGGRAIERVVGHRPYLFRAPFGSMTGRARTYLRGHGYTEVRWSIDTRDYRIANADRLRRTVVRRILEREGGVVLLHDTKKSTATALTGILADLEAENCRRREAGETLIVPVSLHYFITDRDGNPRAVPQAVEARTRRYLERFPDRCRRAAASRPR